MVLMTLGAVSIVAAAFLALGQRDLKRMLAYSSISQVGYIVLGIGLGTPLGIAGGLFHLFNHALAKGLLFLNSGSLQQATGTRNMDEMGGLARRMPITAATTIVTRGPVDSPRATASRISNAQLPPPEGPAQPSFCSA